MNPIYALQISQQFFESVNLEKYCDSPDYTIIFVSLNYKLIENVKEFLESKFGDPKYSRIMDAIILGCNDVITKKRGVEIFDIQIKNNIQELTYLENTFCYDTLYFEGVVNASTNGIINHCSFDGPARDEIKNYFGGMINV